MVGPPLLNFRRYIAAEIGSPGPSGSGQDGTGFFGRGASGAQLATPSDITKDLSQPWPDSDEVVELGVLTIDKPVSDSLDAQKKLLFLPGQLIDGVESSDDSND